MAKLLFYRQARRDGGVRTGVEHEMGLVAEDFQEGSGEFDPRLIWSIDLPCDGAGVPDDPAMALPWLDSMSDLISAGLIACAHQLRGGLDPDFYTYEYILTPAIGRPLPDDVFVSVRSKVNGREAGQSIGQVLEELGRSWDEILSEVAAPQVTD